MIRKKLMVKRIYNNPEVYYGKGAISCLKSIIYTDILILVDQTIKNSSYYEKIPMYFAEKSFKEEIISVPTQENVLNLKEKYNSSKPEVIIPIGGGTVIDTAKVLKVFLDNPQLTFNDLAGNQFCENNEIKLVAIPTTPSTGSEVTPIAVIRDNKGKKSPYINKGFVPDLAILDHSFLATIKLANLFVFASDIFAHGYEGQVSITSTPLLRSIGKNSLTLLESGLSTLKENPKNTKALADVLYAGHLGGIVQGNAYVGVCHALAHALEKQIQISHASSILPLIKPTILWTRKVKNNPIYNEFLKFYDEIGFDDYLKPEIFQGIDSEKWVEDALEDPSISTNPVRMKKENLTELVDWILNQK